MAIDLSSSETIFTDLREHIGHELECVRYGDEFVIRNVAIECLTCGSVLLDADAPPGTMRTF